MAAVVVSPFSAEPGGEAIDNPLQYLIPKCGNVPGASCGKGKLLNKALCNLAVVLSEWGKVTGRQIGYPLLTDQERLLRAVPLVANHRVNMSLYLGPRFPCQPLRGTKQGSTDVEQ